MAYPIGMFFLRKGAYEFRDPLDLFTYLIGGIVPLTFVILATALYLPSFSQEINERFLFYACARRPAGELLRAKFRFNLALVFVYCFLFIFICFLAAFHIVPALDLVKFHPDATDLKAIQAELYGRHTFTQLLQYGTLTYGILYSAWVGLNAAAYSSIGFALLLLIRNRYVALSLPTLIYIVAGFLMTRPALMPYRTFDSIFPFSYLQQPIWTAFIPFLCLASIAAVLLHIVLSNLYKLDSLA